MACGGCTSAVQGALESLSGEQCTNCVPWLSSTHASYRTKTDHTYRCIALGVKDLNINLDEQTVSVVAEPSLSCNTVLVAIKEKGKTVRSGEVDGIPQPV